MPIYAKSKPKREPIAEGLYPAICYGVYDLGTQHSTFYGNDSMKVLICWEIPELRVNIEKDGKKLDLPQAISSRYTNSLGNKATLKKILEGWRGKRFTDEEAKNFDISKLIGVGCQLQVIHSKPDDEGNVYANVSTVLPAPRGVAMKMENERQYFSFADNMDIPANTPEWIEKLIHESKEWKARQNPKGDLQGDELADGEDHSLDADDSSGIPF